MFDIGAWEILVIGVMALIILGPERLPGAIRSTISAVRSIKEVANGFKQEVTSQLDAHELHTNLKKAEALGMQNIGKDLQASVDELKAAAASVQTPYKKTSGTKADTKPSSADKGLPSSIAHNIAVDQSLDQPEKVSDESPQVENKTNTIKADNQQSMNPKSQSTDNE